MTLQNKDKNKSKIDSKAESTTPPSAKGGRKGRAPARLRIVFVEEVVGYPACGDY
jgi:hypothetical protein